MSDRKTFENSYGDYPFAELVRLSLVLAGYARRRRPASALEPQSCPSTGPESGALGLATEQQRNRAALARLGGY